MRKVTRTIYVKGEPFKIWLALAKKRYNRVTVISLMYFIEDPKVKKTPPIKIKEGFKTEAEAIQFGKNYLHKMYTGMTQEKQEDPEEIDWDDIK